MSIPIFIVFYCIALMYMDASFMLGKGIIYNIFHINTLLPILSVHSYGSPYSVPYCIIQYCTVIFSTELYYYVLHGIILYWTILFCTELYQYLLFCSVHTVLGCTLLWVAVFYWTQWYFTRLRGIASIALYHLNGALHSVSHCAVLYWTVLIDALLYYASLTELHRFIVLY